MNANRKPVLILVGPGKHFGLQLARRFGQEGFKIGLIARNKPRLDAFCKILTSEGHICWSHVADVTKQAAFTRAIKNAYSSLGTPTCVIFNVKTTRSGSVLDIQPTHLTNALATNVTGALTVLQAVAKYKRKTQHVTVILTGGGYKDHPNESHFILSLSKAALHSFFLMSEPTMRRNGLILKSVVIDGVVRKHGPIFPEDVADLFWSAFQSKTRREFHTSTKTKTPRP